MLLLILWLEILSCHLTMIIWIIYVLPVGIYVQTGSCTFLYPSLFSNFASCNQVALAKDYYFIETYYFLIVDIEICMYVQGMGEPLQNIENVIKAADIMVHDQGLHFSPRKVTISTSGLVPQLKRFLQECNCALAVSLNATTDEVHLHSAPSLFTGESTCMLLTFA